MPSLTILSACNTLLICLIIFSKASEAQHAAPPTPILHLSDIHLSTNADHYWKAFGDREGDLRRFITHIVPHVDPGVVIITGDLTDSKTLAGGGVQQAAEWTAYQAVLKSLEEAGVPEHSVLDVRGNHDVFNIVTPRGEAGDLFALHSASGRRGAGTERVHAHVLLAKRPQAAQGSSLPHTSVLSLADWIATREAAAKEGRKEAAPCPVAFLLGVDVSQFPSTKNPMNFVGRAEPQLAAEVKDQLAIAAAAWKGACPESPPPVVSYGHFPLSTIHHRPELPAWASLGGLGGLLHATGSVHTMQGVAAALADHADAYVSGHLHTLFGEKLHRLQPSPASPEKHFLAELETGAWKDDRRFRIMVLEPSAKAFADLYFVTPTAPKMHPGLFGAMPPEALALWESAFATRGWGVAPADRSSVVLDHVAMLTWPPDARYFPMPDAPSASEVEEGAVRALVVFLDPSSKTSELPLDANLTLKLPDGTQVLKTAMRVESEPGPGPAVLSSHVEFTVHCAEGGGRGGARAADCTPPADYVWMQLSVHSGGAISTSVNQPAALRCRSTGEGRQACWPAPAVTPAPLELTWVEWFTLLVNWPVLVQRMYLAVWAAHMAGLLLCRYLALHTGARRRILASSLYRVPSSGTVVAAANGAASTRSPGKNPTKEAPVVDPSRGVSVVRTVLGFATWPWAAMVLTAGVTGIWVPLVRP